MSQKMYVHPEQMVREKLVLSTKYTVFVVHYKILIINSIIWTDHSTYLTIKKIIVHI